MEDKKLRVAIYCRVNHDDEAALSNQQETLRSFAIRNGYPHPICYLDNGISGLNFERPALAALQADVEAGKINTVLVRDISRIGRDFVAVEVWRQKLESNGIELITADGSMDNGYSIDAQSMVNRAFKRRKKREVDGRLVSCNAITKNIP